MPDVETVMVRTAETALSALTLIQVTSIERRALLEALPPEEVGAVVLSMAGIAKGLAEALGDLGGPSAEQLLGGYSDRYRHVLAIAGTCRCADMCRPLATAVRRARDGHDG